MGCRRKANASIACPVQPGPYTVEQTVQLPKEIPKGIIAQIFTIARAQVFLAKFLVAVRAFTVDEDDMLCVDLKVDFMPKLPFFRAL